MAEFQIISRRNALELGLKRYFTGTPCIRGHIAERSVGNSRCSKCESESSRDWRTNHPHYQRDWRRAHPEKAKAWREANRENLKAYHHAWYAANKDRRRVTKKAYDHARYAENPEKHLARHRAWVAANPGKRRAWYLANREKINAQHRAYNKAHPRKQSASRIKAWLAANPDKAKACDDQYRHLKRKVADQVLADLGLPTILVSGEKRIRRQKIAITIIKELGIISVRKIIDGQAHG